MVEAAAARFRREQLAVPVRHSLSADLLTTVAERFGVLHCIGNSLVHAAGRDAMVQALTGLRQMARSEDTWWSTPRNREKLHAGCRIVQVANRLATGAGRRCLSFYACEILDRRHDEHIAHIVFAFEDGDQIESREYQITFCPFTLAELRDRPPRRRQCPGREPSR